jgi:hypothetical protein
MCHRECWIWSGCSWLPAPEGTTLLTLETRDQRIVTKYRSVETVAGASATANTPATRTTKRRTNPARSRRSRLRLEQFQKKKEDQKQLLPNNQETGIKIAAGDSSSVCSKLVVQLSDEKETNVETGPHNPILQVDGNDTTQLRDISYSFKSEYGEEDIRLALEEIFPPFVAQLDSRVRLGRLAADHQCIVSLRDTLGQNVKLSWPEIEMPMEEDIFRELKRIP